MAKIIVIDGEIGAGKSTLIKILVDKFNSLGIKTVAVSEPIDKWVSSGLFKRFYDAMSLDSPNKGDLAHMLQTYISITRITQLREISEKNEGAQVYILERSMYSDRFIFAENQSTMVGDQLMDVYQEMWELFVHLLPSQIDLSKALYVYIKPTINSCMSRIRKRSRESESDGGVSVEYQNNLRELYEKFYEGGKILEIFPKFNSSQLLVFNGNLSNKDFSKPGKIQDEMVTTIFNAIF